MWMAKRKSRRKGISRTVRYRKHSNEVSTRTLMVMVILVLVVSVLSATLYVYAFYGNSNYTKVQKSSLESPVIEEKPAASGRASIQIIKRPEDSEK